jgi:hypothetical protein
MPDCCSQATGVPPTQLALLVSTGFVMSLGHCLGMCGPIVSAFAVRQRARGATPGRLAFSTLLYHSGRITAYATIGAALGLLGSVVARRDHPFQGWLSIFAGILMFLLGLGLLGLLPTRRWAESGSLGKGRAGPGRWVGRSIGSLLGARGAGRHIALGFANGFLPCGPVAAVGLSAAAAGSPWRGALAMLAYGLGTVPALFVLGMGAGSLPASTRTKLYRLGAVLVLVIGVQLCLRGLHDLGLAGGFKIGPVVFW